MNRETFKDAWRHARANSFKGSQFIGGLYFSPGLRLVARADFEPRRTYWAVLSQNMNKIGTAWGGASKSDRFFYVRRARAMRRDGFRNNLAGCKQ